jgi:hypothetical protein
MTTLASIDLVGLRKQIIQHNLRLGRDTQDVSLDELRSLYQQYGSQDGDVSYLARRLTESNRERVMCFDLYCAETSGTMRLFVDCYFTRDDADRVAAQLVAKKGLKWSDTDVQTVHRNVELQISKGIELKECPRVG